MAYLLHRCQLLLNKPIGYENTFCLPLHRACFTSRQPGVIAKACGIGFDQFTIPKNVRVQSSGYVIHTLEASIWCLLTTDNYKEAVLKAVNLGQDTDTTGAVTGGLAGLLYGIDGIPANWVMQLARWKDIDDLAKRLTARFASR